MGQARSQSLCHLLQFRTMNTRDLDDWGKASHEAGHAVAAHAHGGKVVLVSILPGEGFEGVCQFSLDGVFCNHGNRPGVNQLTSRIVCALAGPAAHRHFSPDTFDAELARSDYESAAESMARLARVTGRSSPHAEYFQNLAKAHIGQPENLEAIETLATALMARRRLSGRQAAQIINQTWRAAA